MRSKAPRRSLLDVTHPSKDEQLTRLAAEWCGQATTQILTAIWGGIDLLRKELTDQVDFTAPLLNLERQLTLQLTFRIRKCLSQDEPYTVENQVPDEAMMLGARAAPPTPDIGFMFPQQPQLVWTIEAKVLQTDGAVSEYVKDLRNNFLTCRYSPFFAEGAMLGFLLAGHPAAAMVAVSESLAIKFEPRFAEPDREHQCSSHERVPPTGRTFATTFRCHHLVVLVGKQGGPVSVIRT